MISYCIAVYRPQYARLLISDIISKTTAAFEILVRLNTNDLDFERFITAMKSLGYAVKIVGKTPGNIGMAAYIELFRTAQYELIVQIDDDVVCVSRKIAECAKEIFDRFKDVRQLVSDVWQDGYTTGARPPLESYRVFDERYGLYDGPIDGWFSVYHKSILPLLTAATEDRYLPLGGIIKSRLSSQGLHGLLCTRFKVFHVIGPVYANYFGMLDFEINKYKELGRADIVRWYQKERATLPSIEALADTVDNIVQSIGDTR